MGSNLFVRRNSKSGIIIIRMQRLGQTKPVVEILIDGELFIHLGRHIINWSVFNDMME